MTSLGSINLTQIRDLQREAALAGDEKMVAICRRACNDDKTGDIDGMLKAVRQCIVAINAAEALAD